MRFVHCETYQGAIAAVHVEFPTQSLYGNSQESNETGIISPVVMKHFGDGIFLSPVSTVAEAIAAAKAHIEQENRCYVDQVINDQIPASEAVQHFQDCDIPLDIVPPLAIERPYYTPLLPGPMQCVLSRRGLNMISVG
ncbi:MAG: hypothetical protein AAFQ89_07695 [Cyanobacteria bacterium J06626_18]